VFLDHETASPCETRFRVERKRKKLDQGKCSSLEVDVNRAPRKPQDDRTNKEKLQLMKERIHGGKYMEVEIYVKLVC
jgi:hypothetical protein